MNAFNSNLHIFNVRANFSLWIKAWKVKPLWKCLKKPSISTVNDYLWTEGLVYDTNRLSPTMQYWDQFTGASNHTHIFYQVTSIVQMIEWGKSVDLLSSHKHFLLSLWKLKTTWFCELVNRINRLHWGGALVFQLAAPRAGHIQDQNTGSIAILANVFIIYYSYTNIVLRSK